MIDILSNAQDLPLEAWLALAVGCLVILAGIRNLSTGWGLPLVAVTVTVLFWYHGDALYNGYRDVHMKSFSESIRSAAWWQVSWFFAALILLVPPTGRFVNRKLGERTSRMDALLREGMPEATVRTMESQAPGLARGAWILFLILGVFAIIRVGSDAVHYFFPFVEYKLNPWSRSRVASGPLDSLFALIGYLQIFMASAFGLVAVFARTGGVRFSGLLGMFLTWPFFLLDRTRSAMILVIVPALLSFLVVRLKSGLAGKIVFACAALVVISHWFSFVMVARGSGMSVSALFAESETEDVLEASARHEGLNMFEELCWMNRFLELGQYKPNLGQRYFAEIVNPIPRVLWKGKPHIGLDYARVRGFGWNLASENEGGVAATISTGMIGQGLANFGRFFGPVAAAFLASLWIAFLMRLDLTSELLGRLPLYFLGLVATFNLGRDITLLVIYPVVFGFLLIKFAEWRLRKKGILGGEERTGILAEADSDEEIEGYLPIEMKTLRFES